MSQETGNFWQVFPAGETVPAGGHKLPGSAAKGRFWTMMD